MDLDPRDPPAELAEAEASGAFRPLTEEERQALIEEGRRELPALRRQAEESIRRLFEIGAGRY